MKQLLSLGLIILFISCNNNNAPSKTISAINGDSLHKMMAQYAPGLGEIMGGVQTHHAKLWYAGINDNWKLAQYEIDELKERFEQAIDVETDRPEVKMIPMMYPAIDSIKDAIGHKNLNQFKKGFKLLTASCNSCHAANNFEFNIITIPTAPPVSNQDFKVH
jgi:cytochrome c556